MFEAGECRSGVRRCEETVKLGEGQIPFKKVSVPIENEDIGVGY